MEATVDTLANPPGPERLDGVVQQVFPERGFGFIRTRYGLDFFFHLSGLIGCRMQDLRIGAQVTFLPTRPPKGPRAERIELVT
jgi:cold shock CspA family protein